MVYLCHLKTFIPAELGTHGTRRNLSVAFYGSEQDFQLKADKESVRRFGSQFKQDWDEAPLV